MGWPVLNQFFASVAMLLGAMAAADDVPPYVIEAPDILLIDATGVPEPECRSVRGEHLVRPDGERVATAIRQFPRAAKGPVCVKRKSGDVLKIDLKTIALDPTCAANFRLQPGDQVYVGTTLEPSTSVPEAPGTPGIDLPRTSKPITAEETVSPVDGFSESRDTTDIVNAILELLNPLVAPFGKVLTNRYSPDPTIRTEQLILQSENLRETAKDWRVFWMRDQPSKKGSTPASGSDRKFDFNNTAGPAGSQSLVDPNICTGPQGVVNLGVTPVSQNSKEPDTKKIEAWTTQIVEQFFESVFNGDESALGLLSPELAKTFDHRSDLGGKFWRYSSYSLRSHEVAPDGSEVIFRGELASEMKDVDPLSCTLRVAKESTADGAFGAL
jgi:hypothetical protein